MSRRDLAVAFSWSLFNWIADVAYLAFAAYAAGRKPVLAGLTVADAAARAVGSIPLMPAGCSSSRRCLYRVWCPAAWRWRPRFPRC